MRNRTLSVACITLAAVLTAGACGDGGSGPADGTPAGTATGTPPAGLTVPTNVTDGEPASVVRVLDGDSLVVAIDGAEQEVRLLGINAPERTECGGEEARAALEARAPVGSAVALQAGGETDRDRFDRLLRYAYDGSGANLNETMVKDGHAIALAVGHPLRADFRRRGNNAFNNRRGMWAPDACGAATGAMVDIVTMEWNPPGPDGDDLNAEWVEFQNAGDDADLGSWVVRDESSSNRYVFPDGFRLAAGDTVRLHVGCGADEETALFWCADEPVWNNSGDSVILQDPAGNVVARLAYEGI